jgi:ABC-type transporter Mla maintaining outer membrane lipid asymmetry ATPase subunit MlaF
MSTVIELTGVTVPSRRDADLPSVENVNWNVASGEFWVVGGFHGSGKSDLMFMLAGLTRPLRGACALFGQDVASHFGDDFLPNRLRTGIVFDDARLFASRTVAENVSLPLRYHQNLTAEQSSAWVQALMSETGVAEYADSSPGALSRVWRRRVALARALALRPEVLFLENPLRELDRRHSAWWVTFAAALWRGHPLMAGKPVTVIASTDEYWPWANSGAQFARLELRSFSVVGAIAPADESRFEHTQAKQGEREAAHETE